MPARWSRRAVLGLGVAGALTLVAGCSEDGPPEQTGRSDPPPTPSQPPPTPEVPDVPALRAALDRTRTLREQARSIAHPDPGRAGRLGEAVNALGEQERVLEEVLAAGGVPVPSATDPTTSPDGTSATGTAARPGDAATTSVVPTEGTDEAEARARQAERAVRSLIAVAAQDVSPTALEALSEVSAANLAMLTSLAGQRAALVMTLGGDPRWPALPGPAGAQAAAMLPTFQAAVYALEVIAARSSDEARERSERALGRLRALTRDLTSLAGRAAAPAPLGYGLDSDISTREGRDTLAREVLRALPPTVVAAAGAHTGDLDAVAGTVRVLAEVVELGSWWGLVIGPFPGMTLP